MFRRKRSSSNPPRPGATTSSAAATLAASQAFLANKALNANLSASAAAAALRSHASTPTPLGQVQTKRMQRRSSVSSIGSVAGRPGGLQRRDSGGSMTERTFREISPSRPPARPASSHGPYPKYDNEDTPPVPALPSRYVSPSSDIHGSVPRSASIQPTTQKEVLDGAVRLNRGSAAILATPPSHQRSASSGVSDAAHRAANQASTRASVNYSRPMSPQNSPLPVPIAPNGTMSSIPQAGGTAGLAFVEAEGIKKTLQDAAPRPVKKKKNKLGTEVEGSHLNAELNKDATPAPAATGDQHKERAAASTPRQSWKTPNDGQRTESEADRQPVTSQIKKKKKKQKRAANTSELQTLERDDNFGSAYPSDTDSVVSDVSSTTDRSRAVGTRPRGILGKQPSIVREDREGEEKAEGRFAAAKTIAKAIPMDEATSASTVKPAGPASKAVPKRRDVDKPHAEKSTVSALGNPENAPRSSLSPSRALHFSTTTIHESPGGVKHQPLGRSASPAKSAMKYSPSRGQSPSLLRTRGLAASEASDTGSGMSDDGSQTGEKKKRNVRVSFDAESVVIGQAAGPVTTDSPVLVSPQNKSKSQGRIREVRTAETGTSESEPENEDITIEPTPVLPSFGSLRGRKEAAALSKAEKHTSSTPNIKKETHFTGNSSDQNVGAIVSQEISLPKITAYQASGATVGVAASGEVSHSVDEAIAPVFEKRSPVDTTIAKSTETENVPAVSTNEPSQSQRLAEQSESMVPSIAVVPSTPAADETRAEDNEWLGIPRDCADASEAPERGTDPIIPCQNPSSVGRSGLTPSDPSSPVVTPATIGISEPEPDAVAAKHDAASPHVGEVAESLRTQIDSQSPEETTDEESVYSDAAEDQTEPEGDGFGSINAIVESPALGADIREPTPVPLIVEATAEPATQENDSPSTDNASKSPNVDWQNTEGYWSGLSQSQRQQLEQAALPGAIDEPVAPDRTLRGKGTISKKATGKPAKLHSLVVQQNEDIIVAKPTSRKPFDATTGPDAKRLNANRPPPPSPGQASMVDTKRVVHKKGRPVSAARTIDYARPLGSIAPKHGRAVSAGMPTSPSASIAGPQAKKPASKSTLGRTKSDDNDSDSSFKRARSSAPNTGRYQMRRSMRANVPDARQSSLASRHSSLSARGPSPSSSAVRRPFSTVGPGGPRMRTSMRDSIDSSKQSRKSMRPSMDSAKAERTKSPSRLGFTLGSKARSGPGKTRSKAGSSYSSHFRDSSDEDDGLSNLRSSRFADSSDDEPNDLTPVRGIPRKIDQGDSTELEDSSTENVQAPNSGKSIDTQPTTVSAPSTRPGGQALAAGSMRTPSKGQDPELSIDTTVTTSQPVEQEKKRRSFFGGLGSKRKDDPSRARKPIIGSSGPFEHSPDVTVATSSTPIPSPKVSTATATTPSTTTAVASNEPSPVQPSPKPPKLQRRNTPKPLRNGKNGAWPLKPDGVGAGTPPSRPRTSDGPLSGSSIGRPDLGYRRVTLQSAPDAEAIQNAGKKKKKKRFPMLRKALRLAK